MTIRKGEEWGTVVARPIGLRHCDTDESLVMAVAAERLDPPSLGLTGGDLHRTIGSPAPHDRDVVHRLPIDLLHIVADGVAHVAVAHIVVRPRLLRGSWWRGGVVAVMNADHIGIFNVAPRAHPNDGRFDVVEVAPTMSLRDRIMARRRLPNGSHVPHPHIAVRTGQDEAWVFTHANQLWIDGVHRGSVRELTVRIEPDAFAIHV